MVQKRPGPFIAVIVVIILITLVEGEAKFFEAPAMAAHEFYRVWGITFDGPPDVAVKNVLINKVRHAEIHFLQRVFPIALDRKSTRLNSSHSQISYAVFCLKKKNDQHYQ